MGVGDPMVSVLDPLSSSSVGLDYCVVFLGKTLNPFTPRVKP